MFFWSISSPTLPYCPPPSGVLPVFFFFKSCFFCLSPGFNSINRESWIKLWVLMDLNVFSGLIFSYQKSVASAVFDSSLLILLGLWYKRRVRFLRKWCCFLRSSCLLLCCDASCVWLQSLWCALKTQIQTSQSRNSRLRSFRRDMTHQCRDESLAIS